MARLVESSSILIGIECVGVDSCRGSGLSKQSSGPTIYSTLFSANLANTINHPPHGPGAQQAIRDNMAWLGAANSGPCGGKLMVLARLASVVLASRFFAHTSKEVIIVAREGNRAITVARIQLYIFHGHIFISLKLQVCMDRRRQREGHQGNGQKKPLVREFALVETLPLIDMVSEMLLRLVAHNDISASSHPFTHFHSRLPPAISIPDYLSRIVKYASVEKPVLLLVLIYIDRICEENSTFSLDSLTVHRFIIASMTVGAKVVSDLPAVLTHYIYRELNMKSSTVGGIGLAELNLLELEFCKLIQWRLSPGERTGTRAPANYTQFANPGAFLQSYFEDLVRTCSGFEIMT